MLLAARRFTRPKDWWTIDDWVSWGDPGKRHVKRHLRNGRSPTTSEQAMWSLIGRFELAFGTLVAMGGAIFTVGDIVTAFA
jgi:hypothetical protein